MGDINFEALRKDLLDYFGTALSGSPFAMANIIEIENASNNQLLEIALNNGFDLDNYIIKSYYK